jgi:hypothetical protein
MGNLIKKKYSVWDICLETNTAFKITDVYSDKIARQHQKNGLYVSIYRSESEMSASYIQPVNL